MKAISNTISMKVVKRDGRKAEVSFDKVLRRISRESVGLAVNPTAVAREVLGQIHDGVKTTELDEFAATLCANISTQHPDYGKLAARLTISNHQKNTDPSFLNVMRALSNQKMPKTTEAVSYIDKDLMAFVEKNAEAIDARIDHDRDYLFDYFGFKTLEKSYLLKDASGKILERPQHLWMRVSLALWFSSDLERAFETYDYMSQKYFTHATPTLFNAGTQRQQLSSCFLLSMNDDSIAGIYKTLGDCALISKYAGGIGIHCHNIRAKGSLIKGTNGNSNGLVPMLRVFNNTARYVDQCFTPDTLVQLSNMVCPIKDVQIGDSILTTGGYKKVNKAVSHWLDAVTMKAIKSDSGVTVRVTDSHPIFALKHNDYTLEQAQEGVKNGLYAPEYLEVSELNVGDFLIGPNSWNIIEEINDVVYTGPVHDFEIEAPHDYYIYNFGFAHNGGGKRNGSFAIYLEPWHADIEDFLRLKLNNGAEEDRARDLFYALWIPDLFMERVEANSEWTVFCPNEAPGLADAVGDDFKNLYEKYEAEGRGRKTIPAQKLWFQILDSQMETGTPYLCYKDPSNQKSNQKNLGTIKSSNLCTEIIEYSDANESAVCNLASIGLPAFVNGTTFDFDKLRQVTKVVVRNLNRVIDINFYPTPETKRSNMRHRPIGLGVQGLADVFALLKLSWDSQKAADLNQRIFEHMYYAALETSYECAQVEGPYETFQCSPMSKGLLQPDLWNVKPLTQNDETLNWSLLREKAKTGIRNSLLVAPMPTASTSQILGYNECFEPFNSNLYTRRTLAGEYIVVNKYLLNELMGLGLWDDNMKQQLIIRNGSVQGIDTIPQEIQERYKTVYEMKQKTIIDMAAARGAFICQSQSLNLFVADATYAKLTSMQFYAWKQGLKTGCYYLRTKSPVMAQKFTIDPRMIAGPVINDKDECVSDSDTDDEETPEQRKVRERTALKERLAREYEEEAKKAKEAADKGEGCLMCSG